MKWHAEWESRSKLISDGTEDHGKRANSRWEPRSVLLSPTRVVYDTSQADKADFPGEEKAEREHIQRGTEGKVYVLKRKGGEKRSSVSLRKDSAAGKWLWDGANARNSSASRDDEISSGNLSALNASFSRRWIPEKVLLLMDHVKRRYYGILNEIKRLYSTGDL